MTKKKKRGAETKKAKRIKRKDNKSLREREKVNVIGTADCHCQSLGRMTHIAYFTFKEYLIRSLLCNSHIFLKILKD